MSTVTLVSKCGKAFTVDIKVAEKSITIKNMISDTNMLETGEQVIIPNVNGRTLAKVFEWAEYHRDDPPEECNTNQAKRSSQLTPWEAEFIKVDHHLLYDLINAANFLDIKGLLDCCCKTIANMIRGKTPQEIKESIDFSDKPE